MIILLDKEALALRLIAVRLADDFISTRKVVIRSYDSTLPVPDRIVYYIIVVSIVSNRSA